MLKRFTLTSELLCTISIIKQIYTNYFQLNTENKTFYYNKKDKNTELTNTIITIIQNFKQKIQKH